MSDPVLLRVDGAVATITLDREDDRNAMTVELLDAFERAVADVRRRDDVRCVIVTGTGRHFCSGADFRASAELMGRSAFGGQAGMRESAKRIYSSFLTLLEVEVPVVAAMNGHAIGGGLGLALACDVRVANEEAKIGANFVRLGLHPGMAVSYVLPRLVGVERAAELLFTGRIITGAEAERIGLVARAVAADRVAEEAAGLAAEIAEAAPYAVRLTKRSLYEALAFAPRGAVEVEAYAQSLCAGMDDAREGIAALLEKRKPDFRGR